MQIVPRVSSSERIFGSHEAAVELSDFYLRRSRLFAAAAAALGLILTTVDLIQLRHAAQSIPFERLSGNGIFIGISIAVAVVCHLLIRLRKWWTGPVIGSAFLAVALVEGLVLLVMPTTISSPQVYLAIILLATAGGIPLPPLFFHPMSLAAVVAASVILLSDPGRGAEAQLWVVLLASTFVISMAIATSTFQTLRAFVLSKQRREQFLRLLAHDLRNPIGQMPRLASMLVHDATSRTEQSEYAALLETTASGTYNMLENLLQWEHARSQEDLRQQPLSVSIVMGEVLPFQAAYARSKGVSLVSNVDPDLSVSGEAVSVATVLRNLIGNGIKFSPSGSSVEVRVEPAPPGDSIVFSVSDRGDGIPKEVLSAIQSGKPVPGAKGTFSEPGTGLGLLVCARLLEKLGSALEVEVTPGCGTRVRFRLARA